MYLESLLRLAEIVDHFEKKDKKIISEEFHKKTVELIESQTKFLITELEFRKDNPGPYNFGFGDLVITLYSPEETGIQEWAAIARRGSVQKTYRFNSVMGLVKTFVLCIEDTMAKDEKEEGDQAEPEAPVDDSNES
jgi:hypothetical protein